MSNRAIVGLLAALLFPSLATMQPEKGPQPQQPQAPGPQSGGSSEGVKARATAAVDVLNDWHDAAAHADLPRYLSHWTNQSVFLGTDATERWAGKEFAEFAKPIFEKGKGWTYRPHNRKLTFAQDLQHAYFDELLDNDKLGLCRGSGVLELVGTEWKIMQYNLSIPVPNEAALEVIKVIKDKAAPQAEKHKE